MTADQMFEYVVPYIHGAMALVILLAFVAGFFWSSKIGK